jgi:glycosyltransferase involved in cell wall biosynthesis
MLYVDDRWRGEHGIGRFATEVVQRLTLRWQPLGGAKPTSPADVFNPRRLRLFATDVVYSPGFNAGISRARQVLNIHDLIHLEISSEKSFAKTLYYNTVVRSAVRRAGIVMTDSQASAAAIERWLRDPAVEIVVVGCGRSRDFIADGDRVEFSRPTFVYVGNLKPHKNVDVLLDAISLRAGYGLVIVSSDANEAERRVRQRGLEAQVDVRTGISDRELAAIYRGARGALQPSILEGFGLPALEAMSCGTRVAHWSECESVSEICDGTGVSVGSSSDSAEWALALDRLDELATAGALTMPPSWEARYDWDSVAEKVTRVLSGAMIR